MKLLRGAILALYALTLAPFAAHAQTSNALVVSSCNGKSYTAGLPAATTQTTGGQLCIAPPAGGNTTVVGNQSNAGAGTTGSQNLGTNAYGYGWTGSAWGQVVIDSSGRYITVGPETTGSALVGGGLRIMGSDGTDARDIATNAAGQVLDAANAQAVSSCNGQSYTPGASALLTQTTGGALCVNASVSASVGGFTPSSSGARMTPITVTTSDSSGTLPTGAVVIVADVGANPMYCNVNGVAATTSDQLITAGGGWFAFTIPATITTLHCIATGGSTTADGVGGSGLATGSQTSSVSGTNPAAGATGSSVPADASYTGLNNGGNLIGWIADSSGRGIVAGAGTAGTPAGGVLSIQGVSGGQSVIVSQATASSLNVTAVGAGSAGTPNAGVQTIQGITGMTPVITTGAGTAGTPSAGVATVQGSTATGSALASDPVLVGGSDGTDVRNLATNSAGQAIPAPNAATTNNGSTTIATGGAFQSALASNAARKGCLIQNPLSATETLFVFFGANGSATTAKSISLGPGAAVSCSIGGLVVATDNVSVEAATTGHAFVEMDQ
jgi:hypothetical protein